MSDLIDVPRLTYAVATGSRSKVTCPKRSPTPMAEKSPVPTLEYGWFRHDGEGVRGWDSLRLAEVRQIRVYLHDGALDAWALGPMRCKDGHAGPSRCLRVDCVRQGQPDWLEAIIEDACRRFSVGGSDGQGGGA